PRQTAVNLVTTAEEMPVNETIEMYRQVRTDLRMPPGALFVNRLHHADFGVSDLDRLEHCLTKLHDRRERGVVEEAVHRGREEVGWSTINRTHLQRLRTEVDIPLV